MATPADERASWVWKHFRNDPQSDRVLCQLLTEDIPSTTGGTKKAISHLQPVLFLIYSQISDSLYLEDDPKQRKIAFKAVPEEIGAPHHPPPFSTPREALVYAMATGSLAFSLMDNWFFQEFLRLAIQTKEFKLPSRATLAGSWLERSASDVESYLASLFSQCPSLTGTSDGTKRYQQSYWSFTLSGIDSRTWRLHSAAVACEPVFPSSNINGRQSALALARVLVSILERIKIDKSRLDHVVTDNGGGLFARSLASLLNKTVDGVLCAAHRLQTVLRNAFKAFLAEHPNAVGIISSMKALIRYVNKSAEAAQTLLHIQVTENEPI